MARRDYHDIKLANQSRLEYFLSDYERARPHVGMIPVSQIRSFLKGIGIEAWTEILLDEMARNNLGYTIGYGKDETWWFTKEVKDGS